MSSAADEFTNKIMRHVVTSLACNIGWDAGHSNAIDILADVMKRQLLLLARSTHAYAEHYGRTDPNLDDAALALKDNNISVSELEEYIQNFDPITLPYSQKVPKFPLPRESKLNFLRPGSEEVLTRPVHVHEYMPPMIFEPKVREEPKSNEEEKSTASGASSKGDELPEREIEQEEKTNKLVEKSPEREIPEEPAAPSFLTPTAAKGEVAEDSSEDEIEALDSKSPTGKGFVPFSSLKVAKTKRGRGENPALKRVRMMLEEEGHPLREISSVMMTTSGFLTTNREGRLPETRPPKNREFFDPAPPPPIVEKKKKPMTMKRIMVGLKKIDKEKENDQDQNGESDKDTEEPELFGNPDKISTVKVSQPPTMNEEKLLKEPKQSKKHKKKLKFDKDMLKKLAKGLEQRDKDKNKKLFKSQTKLLLDKSKKIKERRKRHAQNQGFMKEEGDDEIALGLQQLQSQQQQHQEQLPMIKIQKHKGFQDPAGNFKLKKLKSKSLGLNPNLISPAKLMPMLKTHIPGRSGMGMPEGMKKPRGRPRKHPAPLPLDGGMPLSAAALANLGRGLMDDRPLKIKKSHMEPDMRSLIPEVQLNLNVSHPLPPIHKAPKPPRMQANPSNLDILMGLPSAPGLIPSNFVLPPPPPLIKMPTQSPTLQMAPAIQITPATPSTPTITKEQKIPFGNICSSLTITPIDMPGQKLPTRYDKKMTPGIGSPVLRQPVSSSSSSISKSPKAKSPTASLPGPIKTESASGITITPIVMDTAERYPHTIDEGYEGIDDYEDDFDQTAEQLVKPEKPHSMLAKLDEDIKSKEQRKKDKERRKELKKEKKKEKKEKYKDKDKKESKDKSEKKKKKDKSLLGAESGSLGVPSIPKLTLKLSGHSGTPTPVDSPNPPQIFVGEASPPLHQKKITIKPLEEHKKRDASPELAFSPLVTRPPKPARAAKTHAAASIAADGMGASISQQIASFPPSGSGRSRNISDSSGSKRGRPSKKSGTGEKPPRSSKSSKAVGGLVTETVGTIVDEEGNKIWICPSCGRIDDGSPMIGCDRCDDWYHFPCVGITETPAENTEWFCPRCKKKKKDKK